MSAGQHSLFTFRDREHAEQHFVPSSPRHRLLHERFWGRRGRRADAWTWHWTRPEPWVEELVYDTVPALERAVQSLMEAFTIDDDGNAYAPVEKWGEAWSRGLDALGVKSIEGRMDE